MVIAYYLLVLHGKIKSIDSGVIAFVIFIYGQIKLNKNTFAERTFMFIDSLEWLIQN